MKKTGRINLLLKEYYSQSDELLQENPYDLKKMEKLKTDALMAKSVESLRSYKEAESELRMLLFNNCDKLLDAVQVVVSIRTGSTSLIDLSNDLSQSGNRLDLITSRRNTNPETKQLQGLIKMEKTVDTIERILDLPNFLESSELPPKDKLKTYLKLRSEVFTHKSLSKYPLIDRAEIESLSVVETAIVPQLDRNFENLKLLLELYPTNSDKRERIIVDYLDNELVDGVALETPEENLDLMKHLLDLLFIGNELRAGDVYVGRIRDQLLPQTSRRIIESLSNNFSSEVIVNAETGGRFFTECLRAHMRIPGVDMMQVEIVIREAIETCIRSKFVSGVSVPAKRHEGDLIHTQCCAIIVDVYEWLTKVIDGLSEWISLKLDDFAHPCIRSCVDEYYRLSLNGVEDVLVLLKHVNNRRMYVRSVNAVYEIFDLPQDIANSDFIIDCLYSELKRIGATLGTDVLCLETRIGEVKDALSMWTIDREESDSANGSFGSRMVSAMTNSFTIRGKGQQKMKELEFEEMVHTRRLNMSRLEGVDVCQEAMFYLLAFFLRTLKVKGGEIDAVKIRNMINEWLSDDDLRHSLELMIRDQESYN
jgi:hypothetical protein